MFLVGYDQGVTGNLLTLESFQKHFPTINTAAPGLTTQEANDRSTYQGITVSGFAKH